MSNPKVVSLQPDRKPASAFPPIVSSVRQQARKQLLVLVRDLLNGMDDALFEMADRSQSNTDHNLYFDSMRQIRLYRGDVESRFVEEVNRRFDDVFIPGGETATDSLDSMDADDISLLNHDDLEISVAISGIVSKVTSQFSLPIMELTRRFDHLAKHLTINERRNPLGPQMVSEAFAAAIEPTEVDIKIRIILLKLFERMVMQRMGPVYQKANRTLMEAGVLKDLPRNLGRGRNASAAVTPRPSGRDGSGPLAAAAGYGSGHATGGASPSNDFNAGMAAAGTSYRRTSDSQGGVTAYGDTGPGGSEGDVGIGSGGGFGTIQALMAQLRGSAEGALVDPGAAIATSALIELLNAVQAESGGERFSIERVPPRLNLREVVVRRARDAGEVSGETVTQLGRADEDVVTFIGLLFDYILNDRNLAIPMKALIARLQIPIVKLAILDKAFFDRSSHPARQLLNELSSAGIGWSSAAELKRDAVYDMIESVVLRVLNGFNDNPHIFDELLDEMRAFRSRDGARNERMEQRVRETESGRARTLAARQEVQKVVNQKACGLRLPRELGRFLSDVWSRVMVYISLRDGVGSAAWEALMCTLDDLLWALQPLDDVAQIDERDSLRDSLIDRLRTGMDLVQLNEADQNLWCELIHGQLEEVSRSDRTFLQDDDEVPRSTNLFPEMDEIVLATPHELTDSYQGEAPAPDFLEKINKLTEGRWLEIRQDDGSQLRAKLATIVRPGDRYVFVNRRGMKIAEKTRMELARDLQDDRLLLLDDSEMFDRALEAVIGNLRNMQVSRD